jgi:putative acetyltransferase
MIKCIRTDSVNEDFRKLVGELDADLRIRDGEDHAFFAQFNKLDTINQVVVAYDNETPVGCGAIKTYAHDTMEVKRMYVPSGRRGQGIASTILKELERWTVESGSTKCRLETGIKQPEAIGLYKKNGYKIIPNFGQYENVESSVCFEKELTE